MSSYCGGITFPLVADEFLAGKGGRVLTCFTGVRLEIIYRDCMALIVDGNDIVVIFFHNINRIHGVGKACFYLLEINHPGAGDTDDVELVRGYAPLSNNLVEGPGITATYKKGNLFSLGFLVIQQAADGFPSIVR